jgi:hypothetical protein
VAGAAGTGPIAGGAAGPAAGAGRVATGGGGGGGADGLPSSKMLCASAAHPLKNNDVNSKIRRMSHHFGKVWNGRASLRRSAHRRKVNRAATTARRSRSDIVDSACVRTRKNLDRACSVVYPELEPVQGEKMRMLVSGRWVTALVVCASGTFACRANQIQNGDFSQGNLGFVTGYSLDSSLGGAFAEGRYNVGVNPINFNPDGASFGDHTTGTGLMLLLNGAPLATVPAWQQVVTVVPNQSYNLAGFARAWGAVSTDPSPAVINVQINGQVIGVDTALPASTAAWTQFSRTWNSGAATSATISIFDANTVGVGNDFAVDDLTFDAVPEPGSAVILSVVAGGVGLVRRRSR